MNDYTKGPWKCISGAFKRGGVIAWEIKMPEGGHISKANADILSATPDLYEALKNLISLAKDHVADAEDWHEYQHAVAAIAKAEGR
jgi:hypothetical protein